MEPGSWISENGQLKPNLADHAMAATHPADPAPGPAVEIEAGLLDEAATDTPEEVIHVHE